MLSPIPGLNCDDNWWCFEPTHLERCANDRLPSGVPRVPMPTKNPDAVYTVRTSLKTASKTERTEKKASSVKTAGNPAKKAQKASAAEPRKTRALLTEKTRTKILAPKNGTIVAAKHHAKPTVLTKPARSTPKHAAHGGTQVRPVCTIQPVRKAPGQIKRKLAKAASARPTSPQGSTTAKKKRKKNLRLVADMQSRRGMPPVSKPGPVSAVDMTHRPQPDRKKHARADHEGRKQNRQAAAVATAGQSAQATGCYTTEHISRPISAATPAQAEMVATNDDGNDRRGLAQTRSATPKWPGYLSANRNTAPSRGRVLAQYTLLERMHSDSDTQEDRFVKLTAEQGMEVKQEPAADEGLRGREQLQETAERLKKIGDPEKTNAVWNCLQAEAKETEVIDILEGMFSQSPAKQLFVTHQLETTQLLATGTRRLFQHAAGHHHGTNRQPQHRQLCNQHTTELDQLAFKHARQLHAMRQRQLSQHQQLYESLAQEPWQESPRHGPTASPTAKKEEGPSAVLAGPCRSIITVAAPSFATAVEHRTDKEVVIDGGTDTEDAMHVSTLGMGMGMGMAPGIGMV